MYVCDLLFLSLQLMITAASLPMVLVGNKCDLAEQRQVQTDEGKKLAARLGCPFIETSAKLRLRVDDLFISILKLMLKGTDPDPPRPLSPRAGRSLSAAGREDVTKKAGSYIGPRDRPKSTQVAPSRKRRSFCIIS